MSVTPEEEREDQTRSLLDLFVVNRTLAELCITEIQDDGVFSLDTLVKLDDAGVCIEDVKDRINEGIQAFNRRETK